MFVRVSRATFLEACAIALLGTRVDARTLRGILLDIPAVARQRGGRFRLQDATAQLFLQHLNTSFEARSADGTRARLVLAEVVEGPVTKNVEQFSLIFHAPAGAAVRDGIHAVQHQALGDFDLFIVPVGASTPRRTVYQACFGRYLSADAAAHGDAVQSAPPRRRT
jgi:hypothetical protein